MNGLSHAESDAEQYWPSSGRSVTKRKACCQATGIEPAVDTAERTGAGEREGT